MLLLPLRKKGLNMAGMPGKENGKEEFRVRVPIPFDRLQFEDAVSIVCGPPIMLKFTMQPLLELGFTPETILTSLDRMLGYTLKRFPENIPSLLLSTVLR